MYLCEYACVCVFVYVRELLCVFFSSLFALGYREAGRRQSTGGVMEREGEKMEGKKGKGDRQIDGGHVRKRKN